VLASVPYKISEARSPLSSSRFLGLVPPALLEITAEMAGKYNQTLSGRVALEAPTLEVSR